MGNFNGTINWDNVFKESENFKNNKLFKFGFIEEFFVRDFYEKLYDTYPTLDTFIEASDHSKQQLVKYWNQGSSGIPVQDGYDSNYSDEWNKFFKYAQSKEFVNNFRKFSGVPVTKLKFFHFMAYKRGGFQFPHFHNVGPSTLIFMVYFSKNWKKGAPGGTFMATDTDESSIIFEPYNLDNTLALFHDAPNAIHGVRYITENVERRALQITLEEHSPESGWSGGGDIKSISKKLDRTIEL